MNKPIRAFTGQILHIDDVVVYLKTERTSINTIKKCKFIGEITEFVDTKVKIRRLSPPNTFVTPDKTQDYGEVSVSPNDVVNVIISKHDIDILKHWNKTD